uniref:Uncharacterized protein n=1 Tax=Avena sativa TaxID=4498 RepID=A0ACD5UMN3_AVESA
MRVGIAPGLAVSLPCLAEPSRSPAEPSGAHLSHVPTTPLASSATGKDGSETPLIATAAATPQPIRDEPETLAPGSTPPRPPKIRRKTLAGVTGFVGFPVQRSSPRLKAKGRKLPMSKLAEQVLCQRLGIMGGDQVTEAAIAKFIQMFDGRLPDIAIMALRALFRLDCDFATAVEDALVAHGGASAVYQAGDTAVEVDA